MENLLPKGKFLEIKKNLKIHYHEEGEGLPVIFLHGSGQGASGYSNFKGNASYFAKQKYRALMPDLLGFGYSSKPEDEIYSADFHVDAIKQFVDGLGLKSLVFVGNSLGGALALIFSLRYPDYVSKLVLMAPGGIEHKEAYMKMAGIQMVYKLSQGQGELQKSHLKKILSLQMFDPSRLSDSVVEERLQIAKEQPKAVWKTMSVPFLGDQLKEIPQPILCFWGADDQFLPVSGVQVIASECQNARSIVLSKCGHWVMQEHQDLFNRYTVDFLNE